VSEPERSQGVSGQIEPHGRSRLPDALDPRREISQSGTHRSTGTNAGGGWLLALIDTLTLAPDLSVAAELSDACEANEH
jgi:hypothetical protein